MQWQWIPVAILGLALLMVVHEGGHHLAARAFKMRVIRFSIGFGPSLWKYRPKGSDTTYQIAVIPFLAYVQIAGMNPLEEVDPDDEGSYANASLIGRITTIFAGPLANYLFASILFFTAFAAFGDPVLSVTLEKIVPASAAERAGLQVGDRILAVGDRQLSETDWERFRTSIVESPGKPVVLSLERNGEQLQVPVTPDDKEGKGVLGVSPAEITVPMPVGEAAKEAVLRPVLLVGLILSTLPKALTSKDADVKGPVGIVEEVAKAAEYGPSRYFQFLGMLSTWLALFNLFPLPALDGGRLAFLGYEAITRRRANARVEGMVHAIGLILFLGLLSVVTLKDVGNFGDKPGDGAKAPASASAAPPAASAPPSK